MGEKSVDNIAILGFGPWATALGIRFAERAEQVVLRTRSETKAKTAERDRRHQSSRLQDIRFPENLHVTHDIERALRNASIIVGATSTKGVLSTIDEGAIHFAESALYISAAKGLVGEGRQRISEAVQHLFPPDLFAVLSGPSFAEEVARDELTEVALAHANPETARQISRQLSTDHFRLIPSTDVKGIELCGAVKNVYAIAAGMLEGMDHNGINSRSALLVRCFDEMHRLLRSLGTEMQTLLGPAGIGDIFLTSQSEKSRNFHFGVEVGKGTKPNDVLRKMQEVAEGVAMAEHVVVLATENGVDVPIARFVRDVITETCSVRELLNRALK